MTYYRYDNVGAYVVLSEYAVAKETPCGVRLQSGKLIIHSHLKRFAYPTKEEAKTAFLARKRKQVKILETRLSEVKGILARPDPFENTEAFDLVSEFDL